MYSLQRLPEQESLIFGYWSFKKFLILLDLTIKILLSFLPVGDAVRDAGDRPGGLAEKHNLQALRPEQQTDPLVLAGWYIQQHTQTVLFSQTERSKHHFSFFPFSLCSTLTTVA